MRFGDFRLEKPTIDDIDAVHALYSDPRVWKHYPSGRFTRRSETEALMRMWLEGWEREGLSSWLIWDGDRVVGICGPKLRRGSYWNLGYWIAPQAQGRGIATRAARYSVERANAANADLPVVARLLEHNTRSRLVAERIGLRCCFAGPDTGNPNGPATRLIYADRDLTEHQVATARA
ncbi:hypothetical protein BSZ39_04245 [Bowdeniella nasicola]|uniref:N-acetyltransferase domain-containing protein n=1 Tax=Bowdeniella nasicola TaxID=208480 RepID=A0A1Q5Q423_9ACTO|nr:hypothetical protein BSZ39_04245 [Bowdeniella nasicola]